MKVLACPPVPELCRTELEGLCDTVSTLNFDGSIVDEDAIDRWDAAFITPQAFMSCGGMEGLFALYDRLAALVTAGKVGYVHLCAAGVDVELFHSVIRACVTNNVCLSHCPGVYAVPMAQYVMTYVMHILRKVPEHTAQQAAGVYAGLTCTDAREACLGVLGAGGIGEEVARMSKGVQEVPPGGEVKRASYPHACLMPASCLPHACLVPASCLPHVCLMPDGCLPSDCAGLQRLACELWAGDAASHRWRRSTR